MAGIVQLKGKWYIRLYLGNHKIKLLPTGTTVRRDAEIVLNKVRRQEIEIRQGFRKRLELARLTIDQGITYFLKNAPRERSLNEKTILAYRLALGNFRDCFGGRLFVDQLRKPDFPKLLTYLEKRGLKPTTINIRLRAIRAWLNYLREKELVDQLPFRVKSLRIDEHLPKFIAPVDLERIYSRVTNPKMLATFRVYEVTGMRLGELAQSHRENDFIIIIRAKGRKQRIVPLPAENIADYDLARENPFTGDYISHYFGDVCRKIGLHHSLHSLRHTFALRKLLETNNISLVKELLGHSSVVVTEIYTKIPLDYLAQVFRARGLSASNDVNFAMKND